MPSLTLANSLRATVNYTPFTPTSLFSEGAQGVWYDPSDFTTLYQDAAGTTPVTAVEQPVGLMKDKSGRGNHAFQTTAASRPVLSARYNLLIKTEQFDDAAWTKEQVTVTANATTAPDGTSTADLVVETVAAGNHRVSRSLGTLQAQSLTVSIRHKAGVGTRNLDFAIVGGGNFVSSVFSTATGEVLANSDFSGVIFSGKQNTVSGPDSQGFYTATITVNLLSAQSVSVIYGLANGTSNSYTGNGTSGIYIWGASLVVTAQAPTAYQRVNTSTDYDTVGFKPYLLADGVDDGMVTNSINFTATDKMTVCAGVRAVAYSSNGFLYGIGSDPVSTAGTFALRLNATDRVQSLLFGSSLSNFEPPIPTIPSTNVTSQLLNIGAAPGLENGLRVNGAAATYAANSAGTGNFANLPLYIGRFAGATNPFNGRFYGMTVVGKTLTSGELVNLETYTNNKTGAY